MAKEGNRETVEIESCSGQTRFGGTNPGRAS